MEESSKPIHRYRLPKPKIGTKSKRMGGTNQSQPVKNVSQNQENSVGGRLAFTAVQELGTVQKSTSVLIERSEKQLNHSSPPKSGINLRRMGDVSQSPTLKGIPNDQWKSLAGSPIPKSVQDSGAGKKSPSEQAKRRAPRKKTSPKSHVKKSGPDEAEDVKEEKALVQKQSRQGLGRPYTVAGETPPEDFRRIRVLPTVSELLTKKSSIYIRPNQVDQQFDNVEQYLDIQFRLIREDFLRPLREGIQSYRHAVFTKSDQNDIGMRVYKNCRFLHVEPHHNGVAYEIQFDISPFNEVSWENSKRLIYGSLLCFSLDNFVSPYKMFFASVCDRSLEKIKRGRLQIKLEDLDELPKALKTVTFTMVETPAFYEAYRHVLQVLQNFNESTFPFKKYIVDCDVSVQPPLYMRTNPQVDFSPILTDGGSRPAHILHTSSWPTAGELGLDPAQYKAFKLALTNEMAIMQGPPGTGKTYMGLKLTRFLLHNRSMWSRKEDPRPILVVCFTNHALDQFLEGIYDACEHVKESSRGIIRAGGRTSSEKLQDHCLLKDVRQEKRKKRKIPEAISIQRKLLSADRIELEEKLKKETILMKVSQSSIVNFGPLAGFMSPCHRAQLKSGSKFNDAIIKWLDVASAQEEQDGAESDSASFDDDDERDDDLHTHFLKGDGEADILEQRRRVNDVDETESKEMLAQKRRRLQQYKAMIVRDTISIDALLQNGTDGFQVNRKKARKRLKRKLCSLDEMSSAEESNVKDLWKLSNKDRWRLYRSWVTRRKWKLVENNHSIEKEYSNACARFVEARAKEDAHILKKANVIGMTTTCAARFHDVLLEVKPRIVIVEEAAEVLETHVLAALNRYTEHVILIGDHQQLRPSTNVYELSLKYHADVSMFERLVRNKIDYCTLEQQHRMSPRIAKNLMYIYPKLFNGPRVKEYPKVTGVDDRVFFISHDTHEDVVKDTQSKSNLFEARYITALCKHLIFQGYRQDQITILTPYSGQVSVLRHCMEDEIYEQVRVTTVDNYQGEENDIILISLVRSNDRGNMGFLNVNNRMCVALSRAKHGMYVIGNFGMLKERNKMWAKIIKLMERDKLIGRGLTLRCARHEDRVLVAEKSEDFEKFPLGGCGIPCGERLKCGHICRNTCHIRDSSHEEYKCEEPCANRCRRGHRCPLPCNEPCVCYKTLLVKPKCGHQQKVPCHWSHKDTFQCQAACDYELDCGHLCPNFCCKSHAWMCSDVVPKTFPCGHTENIPCGTEVFRCPFVCGEKLRCGHSCQGRCGECRRGRHALCKETCSRSEKCKHMCYKPCSAKRGPPTIARRPVKLSMTKKVDPKM